MSRRRTAKKRIIAQDPIYNSNLVTMIINKLLLKGKKSLAQRIFYETMKNIKETTQQDPLEILKKAIENATPVVEVKSRRVGGATYQVPIEVKNDRGNSLALRFIIKSARKRPGKNIITKLGNEILDAYNNIGNSVKKKEEIHKMAEANKAFSTFKV
uniref:Small ribosomal subunit protein uS7c n=1 Tax=Euglena archaeoplastidiata TaxID=1188008 RepID=A0A1X9GCR8_9EUGL|nr:ribosomal protein S7 [Euglena archaeoplastidiata]AKR17930.1 ribosomal protein S7 [Euglena archaeoplastidiata]